MAEFDTAAFSGFDEFFGKDDTRTEEKALASSKPQLRKGKRGGVGSSLAAPSNNNDLSKRLLRVGSKRSRHDEDDEAEDHQDDDDDNHEDVGRTGISSSERKVTSKADVLTGSEKRKLGKKERKRIKQQQREEETKSNETIDVGTDKKEIDGSKTNEESSTTKKKFKRKKVRSRQKNIRKDNRTADEKPKHLIVGKSNYHGRPLTEETRDRLNLPPSKPRSTFFVVDRSPAPISSTEGASLGVEDLLAAPSETKKTKTKSKKKKKKYKNI